METLTFDGYIAKFVPSNAQGVQEAFEFLNAAGRSSQVYARLYEKVEEAVYAGLFWGIWKQTPNSLPILVSTSAIFLHGKDPIAITRSNLQSQEYGTYVEHGATLRRREREGEKHPKGAFLQILMAAPLVQLFCLAGQQMPTGKGQLLVDAVVDNVQQGTQSDYVRNFIRSNPHNWEELHNPSDDLLHRFEASVDDQNVNRAKDFNRFFVTSIPAMAEIVWDAFNSGTLEAEYKGAIYKANTDLSGLPESLIEALPIIIKNKAFFEKLDKRTSFLEARRLFEQHLTLARLSKLAESISDADNQEMVIEPIIANVG